MRRTERPTPKQGVEDGTVKSGVSRHEDNTVTCRWKYLPNYSNCC
jgi:hypothetical protein